jgi:hypothetical protein
MDAAARVTSKGQVTVPKAGRDALGIQGGCGTRSSGGRGAPTASGSTMPVAEPRRFSEYRQAGQAWFSRQAT